MLVITGKDRDDLMDILAGIRVALMDFDADPTGTAVYVDNKIVRLISVLGGKKGVERAARTAASMSFREEFENLERPKDCTEGVEKSLNGP